MPHLETSIPSAPPDLVGAVVDRGGLQVLGMDACLARLRAVSVGRVAFPGVGGVVVLPVTHVVDGHAVAFRTTWGSKRHRAGDGGWMSFEVDDHDARPRSGWSVLVTGCAEIAPVASRDGTA